MRKSSSASSGGGAGVATVRRCPGEDLIQYVKDRPGHDRRYAIDAQKARRELGWVPGHTFENALRETVQWDQDNRQWWERVRSGEYQEYYAKQYG